MSFKDIYCQDRAIDVFQKALKCQRLGHAYIFAGLEGVGKFKTAFETAKVLLCENRIEDGFYDSCGSCKSCRLFIEDSHPDFHHVYKELYGFTEKGKNSKRVPVQLPIDVIREYLIDKVATKPSMGSYSVYVVSETEKLNAASQNAMLKVLEEPPSYCVIFLLCTSMEKLLPTTRSRCQVVRFSSIDEDIIVNRLGEEGIDTEEAKYWARFCQGSVGGALNWSGLGVYDFKLELVSRICGLKLWDAVETAAFMHSNNSAIAGDWSKIDEKTSKSDINRRVQKAVIEMTASVYSDAMKAGVGVDGDIVNFDQIGEIKKLSDRIGADIACEKVENCFQAIKWVDSNVNQQLVYERLLLEMAK